MGALCGELPADEVAAATFAVHRWRVDGLNHRYRRYNLATPGIVEPRCAAYGAPATWWAVFPEELGPELGEDRDRGKDHAPCFSDAAPCPVPRDPKWR